jgi:L-ascorbate metabolism protein UlaG (beta-lactamase superfamily)
VSRSPRRFTNLDGSTPQPFSRVFKWAVVDKLAGRRRKAPARAEVPVVVPDRMGLAAPPAPGAGARLVWLGHASWLVQLEGISLVVDPVLGETIGGLVRRNAGPGLSVPELPPIAAQLVTHNHRDHLDLPTVAAVGAPVVAGIGTGRILDGKVPGTTELAWWGSTRVGGVTITLVPSQHWSRRGLLDANRALWGGFVVEGGGVRVYHAGDTAYFEGFRDIGARFPGIDAALLPIGAYDPAWFMAKQHIDPEGAVQAFVDLGARAFVAMHWGTFKLTDEPLDEPPQRLAAEWARRGLPRERLHVPAIGGVIELPPAAGA